MSIKRDQQSCALTKFTIKGEALNILCDTSVSKYLGKPFGFNIAPGTNDIDDYIKTGTTLLNSKLAPWQKLDAIKTFLFPSFHHSIRTNQFPKGD